MNLKLFRWLPMAIIAMCSQTIFCQEGTEYGRIVFQVVDAKGNKDTVMLILRDDATEGIDEKLGEVNLYGQEPKGDLDIRLIQRTTVNCGGNYWLCGDFRDCSEAYVKSFAENLELKIDNRSPQNTGNPWSRPDCMFVIQIYAKHYPVTLLTGDVSITRSLNYAAFDANGKFIENTCASIYILGLSDTLYVIKDIANNYLLGFNTNITGNISEDITQQSLYPNPSKGIITIEEGKEGEKFDIVDVNGKTIRSVIIESYPFQFDVSGLAKGTYYLKNQKGSEISKFVKE